MRHNMNQNCFFLEGIVNSTEKPSFHTKRHCHFLQKRYWQVGENRL